jgi:crotonobetainyl-CoA:carnitine CoA-transferase CaiB-like acyl-CoA transferase
MTPSDTTGRGPLDGLRVIDLTTVLMGPYATRILGDLGADVIRVESPAGDELRNVGPRRSPGMGWFTLNLQRNKRSVVLDLKSPEGRSRMDELLATADIFVTNLRSRAIDAMGLSADRLTSRHPELIYCIANGFGSDGPYRDRAAYDDVVQAVSGIATLHEFGGGDPKYIPTVIADKVAALHIVYAVLAAVVQRGSTGAGAVIEVPMAECVASFNLVEHLSGAVFEPPLGGYGYDRIKSPHRRPRRARDGWICVLPYTDQNWHDFFVASGLTSLADDSRMATRRGRNDHADELYRHFDAAIAERTVTEWLDLCEAHSIPAAPVRHLDELMSDEHFQTVGLLTQSEHPTEGAYQWILDPIRFNGARSGPRRPAPRLGEHNGELFGELDARDHVVPFEHEPRLPGESDVGHGETAASIHRPVTGDHPTTKPKGSEQ